MPKTNTQNPNEQNRNTNTPNGANYTNPLQNEFENSATYRVIHKVGDKVTESVNNLDGEKISREVQGAVNGVVNEVNRVAETVNRKFNTNARTNYQSPQGQNPVPLFLHADGVLELQAPEYKPESGSEQRARRTV